jgi:hypothetical protein
VESVASAPLREEAIKSVPINTQFHQTRDVGEMTGINEAAPIITVMKLVVKDIKQQRTCRVRKQHRARIGLYAPAERRQALIINAKGEGLYVRVQVDHAHVARTAERNREWRAMESLEDLVRSSMQDL